jgi:Mrp family chromosome partitioning ATPase
LAIIRELENSLVAQGTSQPNNGQSPDLNDDAVQQYHALLNSLRQLRETQLGLLSKYVQKPDQRDSIVELERARQVRTQSSGDTARARGLTFVGTERDMAQALAREWYRQQNDTGFAYQANKKSFDTLVKEAEKQVLGLKNKEAQRAKESETELMTLNQNQIENLERQRIDLEKKFPGIANSSPTILSQNQQLDLAAARARQAELFNAQTRLAGIEARSKALKSHLRDVEAQTQLLSDIEPQIVQLERKKEIEEENYKYLQSSLEKARVDEALDPSKMPNISVVQSPSLASRTTSDLKKILLGLAGGGIALGLGWAFLIELLLDRSVKRPLELETLLGIPPMLSIPYLNGRNPLRLRWLRGNEKSIIPFRMTRHEKASWDDDHFIRPYSEAIRDRLVLYFELNRLNHKPKLVAVTGCSEHAGASTLAGGIAAALSETGDGKVLLVDMNVRHPEIHPFFCGAPACSLTEALVGEPAQAGENLYLATAGPADSQNVQLVPRKFYDLMPHLKASDFDYIIFDLPTFSQTSIALPMSRFMDKVLIVAEAEKSSRDIVKRAKTEIASVGASISVILNKVRSRVPKWVGAEG